MSVMMKVVETLLRLSTGWEGEAGSESWRETERERAQISRQNSKDTLKQFSVYTGLEVTRKRQKTMVPRDTEHVRKMYQWGELTAGK